jgi:pimeloyl-ACP methyl ester carboxylesterase
MVQHNPPFWYPAKQVRTPLLWLAGEIDATISVEAESRSAAYYKAEFIIVSNAAHNLMMEHNYRETAETIHNWLNKRCIK